MINEASGNEIYNRLVKIGRYRVIASVAELQQPRKPLPTIRLYPFLPCIISERERSQVIPLAQVSSNYGIMYTRVRE